MTKASSPKAQKKKKPVGRILFPMTMAIRTDKRGNRYLAARVSTIIAGESVERTLMARGSAIDSIANVLKLGKAVKIAVNEDQIPQGGLFYTGLRVLPAPKAA